MCRHDLVFSGSEAGEVVGACRTGESRRGRLRRTAAFFGANDVDTKVVTGVADAAIFDAAARSEADLVVMGIPYRSWLDRVPFGSTLRRGTASDCARSRCPRGGRCSPVAKRACWSIEISSRVWTESVVDRLAA